MPKYTYMTYQTQIHGDVQLEIDIQAKMGWELVSHSVEPIYLGDPHAMFLGEISRWVRRWIWRRIDE